MPRSKWLLRPVFICGHQRSGTTLLQNLLDGHPRVLLLPSEGTYFTSFAYVARGAPSELAMDRFASEWIARLVDPNFEPHFRLGKSDSSRNPARRFRARSVRLACGAADARRAEARAAARRRRGIQDDGGAAQRALDLGREDPSERTLRGPIRAARARSLHPARPRSTRDVRVARADLPLGRKRTLRRGRACARDRPLAAPRDRERAQARRSLSRRALRRLDRSPRGGDRTRAAISRYSGRSDAARADGRWPSGTGEFFVRRRRAPVRSRGLDPRPCWRPSTSICSVRTRAARRKPSATTCRACGCAGLCSFAIGLVMRCVARARRCAPSRP